MNEANSLPVCGRRKREVALAALAVVLACANGFAQAPAGSQFVGATDGIRDEFGALLQGVEPGAVEHGLPYTEGDRVQILQAPDNVIYPPDQNGAADPRNPVLMTTRIGRGVSPTLGRSGQFSAALAPRPGGNSRIFVRVFNAPTLEEATFYGDSQLFMVKNWKHEVFLADIDKTALPLDPYDDDGDGLHNSWEASYGTDSKTVDTDGDGFSDGEEVSAHTDVLDAESFLSIRDVRVKANGDLEFGWDAAPGARYRVQRAAGTGNAEPVFVTIATVTATNERAFFAVPEEETGEGYLFRVVVVE